MTKLETMQAKLATLKTDAQAMLDENKTAEAQAKMEEIKDLKAQIEMQTALDATEIDVIKTEVVKKSDKNVAENATFIRAALKKVCGKSLTEKENALLLPTSTATTGENGEGYILPQDIQTQIHKKIREYKSMRDVLGYIKTTALKGSFPVENFETVTGLIDFADGTDGTEASDISFTNVSFTLAEKAAFIKLSNTLLALTDNDLIAYIVEVFARKAVITENALAVETLKNSKTVKTLADWKALKSSINKDLDPAALFGTVIVTNQDGFDMLDSALDTTGRPVLQPNPANPTQRLFMGYPVMVFSNALLPTTAATTTKTGSIPIFYGNIAEGAKFVDLGQTAFATSSEAGFMSNTTVARLIEFVTTVQCDASDKCYICGQFEIAKLSA